MKTKNNFVDLRNSRGGDQDEVMKKIIEANEDPFSPENIKKYHKQPVLLDSEGWIVTLSQYPYQNTKQHFLLISKRYVEQMSELQQEEILDLFKCFTWLKENHRVEGGALGMRFGDTILSGATVKRLHAHIIVPDTTSKSYEKDRVKFFIGGNKK